jgi:hypothetical protein
MSAARSYHDHAIRAAMEKGVIMGLSRASVRRAALLSVAGLVALAALWRGTQYVRNRDLRDVRHGGARDDVGWYTPDEDDFRREYERDRANQKLQTWIQYWSWVTTFYNGTKLYPGWSSQVRSSVGMVRSKQKQDELIMLVNELGKQIAMEWAKDKGVGRISTADLIRWSPAIMAARRAENGSGERLKEVVLKVRADVARKLGLPPPPTDV